MDISGNANERIAAGEYVIGIRLNQGGQIAQASIGVITVMEGIDMQ